jgi:hypothetical protein
VDPRGRGDCPHRFRRMAPCSQWPGALGPAPRRLAATAEWTVTRDGADAARLQNLPACWRNGRALRRAYPPGPGVSSRVLIHRYDCSFRSGKSTRVLWPSSASVFELKKTRYNTEAGAPIVMSHRPINTHAC